MSWFVHRRRPRVMGNTLLRDDSAVSRPPRRWLRRAILGSLLIAMLSGAAAFCAGWRPRTLDCRTAARTVADTIALPICEREYERSREPSVGVALADLLHRGWSARHASGSAERCHAETLLSALAHGAGLVTVLDGSPSALSWLGGVAGMRVSPLGTDSFGQTGDVIDLYREYQLDAEAIVAAATQLLG